RLRAQLVQEAPLSGWQRLKGWLAGVGLQPLPLSLATTLILLALVLGGWWIRRQQEVQSNHPIAQTGKDQIAPLPTQPPASSPQETVPQDFAGKPKPKQSRLRPPGQSTIAPRVETREEPIESQIASTPFEPALTVSPFINPETAKHFETAQLLLRSFRNAD